MRFAVIGSGVSGLVAAWLLRQRGQVTVFEADSRIGGHVHTHSVAASDGAPLRVDTGFIVCNQRTYPNFLKLLTRLGVGLQDSDMSFAVSNRRLGIEYHGSSIPGLFATAKTLVDPAHYRMLYDTWRFFRATRTLKDAEGELAMGPWLRQHGYSQRFIDTHLLPLTASIWSMPSGGLEQFPARFLARFLDNHGMNSLGERPQWYTVQGGSRAYVDALIHGWEDRFRLNTPVRGVTRHDDRVTITTEHGSEDFDQVVLACHCDQALRMLTDADGLEREVLSATTYAGNATVLHHDAAWMPKRKNCWSSWNFITTPEQPELPKLTYWMNRLQRLGDAQPWLVSLNSGVNPASVVARMDYAHPQFTSRTPAAQARQDEVNGRRRTYFAGAYWGFGFHEDGVNSALAVAKRFGVML